MENNSDFKGMTIRQIRHRKLMVELQKELAEERLQNDLYKLRQSCTFKGKGIDKAKNVASAVLGKSSYLQYFMIGLTAAKTIRSVVKFFKR